MNIRLISWALLSISFLTGCASNIQTPDYTLLREYRPRSILVLPPLNESTDLKATYSVLSTVSRPLAEMGYYVYPVAVIDRFLKENGMPTPGEMHQIPLHKIDEIIGADAVLYLVVNEYGTKYAILDSATVVQVTARLVDVRSGRLIWDGRSRLQDSSSSGSNDIVGMLIIAALDQVLSQTSDKAHLVAAKASDCLFMSCPGKRLPYGPYRPEYETD